MSKVADTEVSLDGTAEKGENALAEGHVLGAPIVP
jgi:hypothetical protein